MASIISAGTTSGTAIALSGDTTGDLAFTTQAGANTITVPNTTGTAVVLPANTLGVGNATRFKNRIINGDMRIDQRNNGASVTPTNQQYLLDRWLAGLTQSSKFTVQQDAGAVTPPVGFVDYLGCTSTSAYAVPSGDTFFIQQNIEGLNISDLAWGTANAKTVTLSFWVRSSLTGTFGGNLTNNGTTRSYPISYSIPVANTWTQISITIAGDTTGTWLVTNGIGLKVTFSLGTGTSLSNTAGAWVAGNFLSSTGAVSVVGTNGATFYVTGVQLEVGSTATAFEYVDYGIQLNMCQRYYQQILGSGFFASGVAISGGQVRGPRMTLLQTMRVAPAIGLPSAGTGSGQLYYCTSNGSAASIGSISAQQIKQDSFFMECEGFNGLSAGNGSLLASGSGNATITISAEL
jgi:hypothetical protein